MSTSPSTSLDLATLAAPALAFAVGTLVAGYATLTAWTNAYMNANPAVGSVSGGSATFTLGLFLVGTTMAFLAVFVALHRVREATE